MPASPTTIGGRTASATPTWPIAPAPIAQTPPRTRSRCGPLARAEANGAVIPLRADGHPGWHDRGRLQAPALFGPEPARPTRRAARAGRPRGGAVRVVVGC